MTQKISRRTVLASTGALAAAGWLWTGETAAATYLRPAAPLDVVVFGDEVSEASHAVSPAKSRVVAGALDQPARVLDPQDRAGAWGGTIAFTVKCVPHGTTYVTIKLPLDIQSMDAHSPGRFHFHTLPLPESLTKDREQVTLEIRAMGRIWGYGQNSAQFYRSMTSPSRPFYRIYTHAEPYFSGDGIQGPAPATPVRPQPGPEVLEKVKTRVLTEHRNRLNGNPASLESWAYQGLAEGYFYPDSPAYQNPDTIDQVLAAMDARYAKWLTDPTVLTASDQQWEGFGKVGHTLVLLREVLGDRLERPIGGRPVGAPNPGFERGGTAPAGWGTAVWAGTATWLWDDTVKRSGSRSVKVTVSAGGAAGWNTAQNRTLIGQGRHRYGVWVNTEGVAAPGAYLDVLFYDAAGKIVGTDNKFYGPTGTNDWTRITAELTTPATATELRLDVRVQGGGTAWFDDVEVTPLDGATPPDQGDLPIRRDAYQDADREHLLLAQEHAALQQPGEDLRARHLPLQPGAPADRPVAGTPDGGEGPRLHPPVRRRKALPRQGGRRRHAQQDPRRALLPDHASYRAMRLEAAVGWRDDHYPGDVTYAQREDWDGHPLMASAVFDDPGIVGRGKRMVADNQFFGHIELVQNHSWPRVGLVAQRLLARDWPAFSAQPDSGTGFPMDWDAPGFVFSDEENGVVAIKNGNEILYASLYWRARQAVNDLARIHHITPDTHRVATVRQQSQVTPTGETYTEQDWVCFNFAINDPAASHIPPGGFPPPGPELHQASAGTVLKVGPHPADVPDPGLGVSFPGVEKLFVGRAQFYRCSYGRYLIGMNTDAERPRRLYTTGPGQARDLTTGRGVRLGVPIEVAPLSTVVLYLDD